MILIAHRGNFKGRNINAENTPEYIDLAIKNNFDVEIDVWVNENGLFLGHDSPETKIDLTFLIDRKSKLWCHAKNLEALEFLLSNGLHTFSHDKDDYIITSHGIIWANVGMKLSSKTICVMPERADYRNTEISNCLGICSDDLTNYLIT